MPRPKRCRRVCGYPKWACFEPEETAGRQGFIILSVDEFETIRLIDYRGMTQLECAKEMQVSRTTVTGIYDAARRKIADALVNGRRLIIAGGDYTIPAPADADERSKKGEQTVRVAVTYDNGEIFQHFGRTEQFRIYDVEDGKVTDRGILSSGGEGHGALAGVLKGAEADVLICGGIGGGARQALAAEGIELYAGASGSAEDAVKAFAAGTLSHGDDVTCSHHGEGHGCGHGQESGCHHGEGHGCGHAQESGCRHGEGHGCGHGRDSH